MLHVDYAGFDQCNPLRRSILLERIAQVRLYMLFFCGCSSFNERQMRLTPRTAQNPPENLGLPRCIKESDRFFFAL